MAKRNLSKVMHPLPWKRIGAMAVGFIQTRSAGGRDRKGKVFPGLSEQYARIKARGFKRRDGKMYKRFAGRSLRSRKTTPTDFTLRGVTLDALEIMHLSKRSVIIGWRGEAGMIVNAHEEDGRYKVGGITDKELKKLSEEVGKALDKNWKIGVKNRTVIVRI